LLYQSLQFILRHTYRIRLKPCPPFDDHPGIYDARLTIVGLTEKSEKRILRCLFFHVDISCEVDARRSNSLAESMVISVDKENTTEKLTDTVHEIVYRQWVSMPLAINAVHPENSSHVDLMHNDKGFYTPSQCILLQI
jgi:hypothetical protein